MKYISDQEFVKIEQEDFVATDFENCHFKECDLNGIDLSKVKFIDCSFDSCNLSLAKVNQAYFTDCKMLGILFEHVNTFSLELFFQGCNLSQSSFYSLPLKNTQFIDCVLHEVDYSETILVKSVFDNCDLTNSIFESTNLEEASFETSVNFQLNPLKNNVNKLKVSLGGLPGLLTEYNLEIL